MLCYAILICRHPLDICKIQRLSEGLLVDIDIIRHVPKHLHTVGEVVLDRLGAGRHVAPEQEQALGFAAGPDAFADHDLVQRPHGLVLVAVDGQVAAGEGADHLLRHGAPVVCGEGGFAGDEAVGHAGVEDADDGGEGADVEGGDFFGEDFSET